MATTRTAIPQGQSPAMELLAALPDLGVAVELAELVPIGFPVVGLWVATPFPVEDPVVFGVEAAPDAVLGISVSVVDTAVEGAAPWLGVAPNSLRTCWFQVA
jgi:hypothetical protein